MASPERTSSTRRFCWRPSGVSLVAMGSVLPKPWASTDVPRNSLLHEIIADGLRAALREILIVLVAADAVGVSFDGNVQAGISEHDAGNFGEALAGSGQKLEAAAAEQDVGHIGDEAAGGVARGENRIELLQEAGAEFLLFVFRLLAKIFRLRGGGFGLVGFGGENLLLRDGFRFGFLGFFFLARGFLRGGLGFRFMRSASAWACCGCGAGLFGLHASLLGLSAGGFGIGAALGFGGGIGAGLGFAGSGGGLGFIFGLLLHGHQARFFGGLGGFFGGGFDCCLVLFLAVELFGVHQLLPGLGKNRRRRTCRRRRCARCGRRCALRKVRAESWCRCRRWRPECANWSRSRCCG